MMPSGTCGFHWRGCILPFAAVVIYLAYAPASAQEKVVKKPQAAKPLVAKKKARDTSFDEPILGPVSSGQNPVNPDETDAGRQKFNEAKTQARAIFVSRDNVVNQRVPLIPPRDNLVIDNQKLAVKIGEIQQELNRLDQEFRRLKGLAGQKGQNVNGALTDVKRLGDARQSELNTSQTEFNQRSQEIAKLNQQILAHNQELARLWQNLNVVRRSWLDVRQPQRRYGFGEYEAVKEMTAEWLEIDKLWPELFAWAALCEYELGNYLLAGSYLNEAEKTRTSLGLPKAWPQGDALRGMIGAKLPEQRGTAAKSLQTAINATKLKTDWQVHFLIGRASFENERKATQAKSGFERALKVNSDLDWVKYWNARLQTTSTAPAVQNVAEGTKTLEALWEKSSKKSWRLSNALVQAYDAADRKPDADKLWAQTLELAPQARHEKLATEREEVVAKRKAAVIQEQDSSGGVSKAKTGSNKRSPTAP